MTTLLIVDDEKSTRDGLRMALEDEFDCYLASSIKEAMSILKSEPIDLMLTDLRLAGDSGMDSARSGAGDSAAASRGDDDGLWLSRYRCRGYAPWSMELRHQTSQPRRGRAAPQKSLAKQVA